MIESEASILANSSNASLIKKMAAAQDEIDEQLRQITEARNTISACQGRINVLKATIHSGLAIMSAKESMK